MAGASNVDVKNEISSMMASSSRLRRKVLLFASFTRLAVLTAQALFNHTVEDHDADAFRSPRDPDEIVTPADKFVEGLFGGMERWDAQYFMHVAKYGYTHENTLAFFPMFPLLTHVLSYIPRLFLNVHSSVLLSAVILNQLLFVGSALALFELGQAVLLDDRIAYRSAILYCMNPASVFFSAPYSESLYAFLTFTGMLLSHRGSMWSSVVFGLSSGTRSNGLINAGYIAYHGFISSANRTISDVLAVMLQFVNCWTPFFLYQQYAYRQFCRMRPDPEKLFLAKFCTDNDFMMRGTVPFPEWCNKLIPISYGHIQSHYWDVGLLRYYEWKQLPNFALAAPIFIILAPCLASFIRRNQRLCLTLGLKREKFPTIDSRLLPYIIHTLWMLLVCLTYVHIQVTTRMLCSATPLLYWFAAQMEIPSVQEDSDDKDKKYALEVDSEENLQSSWKVFVFTERPSSRAGRLIRLYFVSYFFIGTAMFSNFYPWT